jgi:PAS domain S-box-containing protein
MGEALPTQSITTQLFRDAFNASPIGIAVENLDGQPLFVNPALCSMLGFSEEELRGKHCVQFSPPDDAEKDWALFQKLRAGSIDHYQLEKRYFRQDGSLVWGLLSLSLLNHRPSPLVLAMVEDITEKKTAEEARFRHAAIIESSQDAIASGTLDGIIVSWNAGAQRMYGYTEKEAIGKPITMLVPPELPDEENKILETLKAGNPIEQFETVRVTKTGKRINVSLSISPIKDSSGRIVGVSGIARDITERKRAEEALAEMNRTLVAQAASLQAREELLRVFVKNVPAAVAMLDRDMRYLQVSDRWCSDYLPGREQILGRSHYEIFPDMPERWKEVHRRALQGETLRADEDRWEAQDGIHWARWEVRPWKTAEGSVGGILILAEVITRRKQIEEALSEIPRKLIEVQEQERTRIGRELHDDIGQRLSLLAIQLQQLNENSVILPEVRSSMGELHKQISEIAVDIQSLSHELHSAKLQYLGIVGAMRGFCREFGEQQKVEIDFQSHDLPSPVSADVSLCFLRLLQEALHNAAKHSGVRHFEVRLWGTSDEIHLTIKDSGAGFDLEAAKTSQGLGLISMEERLRLVKGTLSIDSQPKRGTTIHARVPLSSGRDSMRAAG